MDLKCTLLKTWHRQKGKFTSASLKVTLFTGKKEMQGTKHNSTQLVFYNFQ